MLVILASLGAASSFAFADFLGGVEGRRCVPLVIALASHIVALVAATTVWLATSQEVATASLLPALLAGVFTAAAAVTRYTALAIGPMSIVSPLTAAGVVIPVLVSVAGGERLAAGQGAGMVILFLGVLLAVNITSLSGIGATDSRRASTYGLVSAAMVGVSLVALDMARDGGGNVFGIIVCVRAVDVALLSVIAVKRGLPAWPASEHTRPIVVIGIAESIGMALLVWATGLGALSIVAVLASLYPVLTVALGYVVLAERIAWSQWLGISSALVGVALISAGT